MFSFYQPRVEFQEMSMHFEVMCSITGFVGGKGSVDVQNTTYWKLKF